MDFLPGLRPFQEPPGHFGGCLLITGGPPGPLPNLLEGRAPLGVGQLLWGSLCSGGPVRGVPPQSFILNIAWSQVNPPS